MSSTANNPRPRHNPLLWASLLPSANTPAGDSRENHITSIPTVPENKINTSLRVVLHDTKATLEQFSDRLGKLVDGVEQAKRDIDKVGKNFDEVHDKVLDELNAVINRSQKGLLEVLGTPAQAAVLDDVKNTQATSDRKLDALENRIDLVHKQLQALSEQQGHLLTQQGHILTQQGDILTSLATITPLAPLLKDLPQHQTQISASLTALMPLLPLLEALPGQVKASQQEVLKSFTASIDINCSRVLSQPQQPKHSARITTSSSEVPPHHVFHHKHYSEANAQEEHQLDSKDEAAWNSPRQQTAILPSSPSEVLLPAFERRSLPPSSEIHHGFPSSAQSAAVPIPEGPIKSRKRQRLEENSDGGTSQKNMLASDTVTPIISSSSTLRSDTSTAATATRCVTGSRSFRVPALPSMRSASFQAPVPAPASSVPVPHAPVQSRSTVPGRLLASTSHLLNRTPTPPPRISHSRRQTTNGRNLVSLNSIAPSSPPFAHRRNAPELLPSNAQVGGLVRQSPGDSNPSKNALTDIQAYASSESEPQPLSRVRPLVSSASQLPHSEQQPKIMLNDDMDIDLDWGDMAPF